MSFFVDWSPNALDALASIWMAASDPAAVTAAEANIDQLLGRNPLENAEPISEGLYAIAVQPLRVLFEISDADRKVTVVSVGRIIDLP